MNETEYENKLKRIEEIFDAVDGPEAEELKKLVSEVEEYENIHYPIK